MGAAPQIQFTADRLDKPAIYNHKAINYSKYSKFDSLNDFNNQYAMIMADYKHKFTKTQLRLASVIAGYAGSKFFGVCTASFKTIAEKFEERFGTTVSRDTWRTTVNKLDKYGILNKHDGVRMIDGRNSRTANVLIFNRYNEVKAYAIAKMEAEQKEIERLLDAEYARMTPIMTYAHNARKWAEEKAIKRAEQAEKERREAQKRAEEEKKAKKASLYVKIRDYIQSKKLNINVNEFTSIAYGSIKKLMATVKKLMATVNISQDQAEELAYSNFLKAVNAKKVKKTHAALYSWLMKDAMNKLSGQDMTMTNAEMIEKTGRKKELLPQFMIDREQDPIKRAALIADNEYLLAQEQKAMQEGREKLPEWFNRRNDGREQGEQGKALEKATVDFEKARAEVLKKLGKQ